jgi:hypothetical protein
MRKTSYKKEEMVLSLREVWRWILDYMDNETLFEIYKETKVNFAGFRALKSPNDLNQNKRMMLINELTKPKNVSKLNFWMQKFEEKNKKYDESIGDKELSELAELAMKEYSPAIILSILISRSKTEKAEQLYSFMLENIGKEKMDKRECGYEVELTEQEKENDKEAKQNEDVIQKERRKEIEKLEKKYQTKIAKLEAKNQNLKEEIEKRDAKIKEINEKTNEEKQELLRKLNEKTQAYAELEKRLNALKKKLEEREKTWENEKRELIETIEDYKKQNSHLHARILSLTTQIEENKVSLNNSRLKKKIALVGNPYNDIIKKQDEYDFFIVEESDLETYEFPEDIEECWVLNYRVNLRQRRQISKNPSVKNKNIQYIENFEQLVKKIKAENELGWDKNE